MEPMRASSGDVKQLINSPEFKESPISKMPTEVLMLIFDKLGVNDIDSMRSVCRSFKTTGDSILYSAAVQLKIPVKSTDDIKTIKAILKTHAELSALRAYFEISKDGKSIRPKKQLSEKNRVKFAKSIEKFLAKFPDHPYAKGLRSVCSYANTKYQDMSSFVNLASVAMEELPSGSWVNYASPLTSATAYVYKDKKGEVHHHVGRDAPANFDLDPAKQIKYIGGF